MGRLCGGAPEILGIPAPLCLCGWVVGGFMEWVVGVGGVVGGVLVRGGCVMVCWGWMGSWGGGVLVGGCVLGGGVDG